MNHAQTLTSCEVMVSQYLIIVQYIILCFYLKDKCLESSIFRKSDSFIGLFSLQLKPCDLENTSYGKFVLANQTTSKVEN